MVDNIVKKLEKQIKAKKELVPSTTSCKKQRPTSTKAYRSAPSTSPRKKENISPPIRSSPTKKCSTLPMSLKTTFPPWTMSLSQEFAPMRKKRAIRVIPICAKLEEEIAQLSPDKDAREFLQTLGLEESGLDRLIKRPLTPSISSPTSPRAKSKRAPGRSKKGPTPKKPPEKSTPTSKKDLSAPKSSPLMR